MTNLILRLLKTARVNTVEQQDLYLQILSHADYPSLKSITDSLDYFGIENIAANVPKDALSQLPSSFLALINGDKQSELVLIKHNATKVVVTRDNGKKHNYTVAKFKELWTGTIIAVEVPNTPTSKPSFKISKENIFVVIFLLLFFGLFIIQRTVLFSGIYIVLSLLGLGISYLIIKETTGKGTKIAAKVCGALSSNLKGCSAVISSKQGVVFKGLSLGDISLMYFLSTTFCSAILGVNVSTLLIIAALSLPVVLYTIYTQAFVLKSWCFLCLGIASILLLQFIVLASSFVEWEFTLQYIVSALFISVVVTMTWLLMKSSLKNKKLLNDLQKDYLMLKRDASVLEAIIENNRITKPEILSVDTQIFFGNREGVLQLTAYTNPLCGYCTEAFEAYDKMLSKFPDDIGVQFVFITPEDNANASTKIAKRVVDIYNKNSGNAFVALRSWFSTKDIDSWVATYGQSTSMLLTSEHILDAHRRVASINKINYTPETLIGVSKFSRKHYNYRDIPLFINYLKERKKENSLTLSTA